MLINRKKFVQGFKQRIEATKKVSRTQDLEETLNKIYHTLWYFNSLPEFTVTLEGRPLADIIIADEWKDFISPESVRLDPTDLKTTNVLVRESFDTAASSYETECKVELEYEQLSDDDIKAGKTAKVLNKDSYDRYMRVLNYIKSLNNFNPLVYNEFLNDQLRIRSYFKTDLNSNYTNLATLRVNKSLSDIIPIMAVKIDKTVMCRSLDDPYIPVEVNGNLNCLFRTDYYNVEMEYMFADYMSKKEIK